MKLNWDKNLMAEARDKLLEKENLDEYDESLIKSLLTYSWFTHSFNRYPLLRLTFE